MPKTTHENPNLPSARPLGSAREVWHCTACGVTFYRRPRCPSCGSNSIRFGRVAWVCDLGNGQWDHDWQEKSDSSGELDGGPGDHWTWRECRVCGQIETPNEKGQR